MACNVRNRCALVGIMLVCCGLASAAAPVDALAFYNAGAVDEAKLMAGFDPASCVALNEVALNGWGHPSLVRKPSPRPCVLAAFEEAGPVGFSRADTDAAIVVTVRQLPGGRGEISGVLQPVGLKFRQPVPGQQISIPIPAACLPAGDYTLRVCLRAGEQAESAELPVRIGPTLQRDRFHAYSWNSGGSNEEHLAAQMKLAKLGGMDVLDTSYLPAATALKEGFLVSAHYVTIYQNDVKDGHAAVEPYIGMAREQSEAIGDMARRYRHLLWCITNSEYGADGMSKAPSYAAALKAATGLELADLRLTTDGYPIPKADLPQLSPGVYSSALPEIAAHRFARRHGGGWFEINRQSMAIIRQRAPGLTLWTDPVTSNEQFEGFDAVSFWHYDNNVHQTIAYTQQAECARRLSGAKQVFLTLSQWYSGIAGAKDGWGLRSPDQHRFNAWLALTLPVHALGYWAIDQLADNPDCATGLREALQTVAYPYGTLLKDTKLARAPVALYVSTTGDFLGRARRAHNFWAHTHYLNGVVPALFERFGGQVEWVDDGDVLAGRLKDYALVLCPMMEATTDELLAKLQAYQAAGGLLAGDEYWAPEALAPALRFPGKSTDTLGLPYANESLAQWHRLNRDAIVAWQPEAPGLEGKFALRVSSADAPAAVRDAGGVRFAVVANGRFRQGAFAQRHGYTDPAYREEGVDQEVELLVQAPATAAVYDVTNSRRMAAVSCPAVGGRRKLRVALGPVAGAIFAFHPRPLARVQADLDPRRALTPGTVVPLALTVLDDRGKAAGATALRVTVRDAQGRVQDVSGVYPAPAGTARVSFGIPIDAAPGTWQIEADDLTSGLRLRTSCTVKARPAKP